LVRYTLTIENTSSVAVSGLHLIDTPPMGFSYVDGSLQVLDADGIGGVAGVQPLRITGVDIPADGSVTIHYLLRVGAGIGGGEHTNTAQVFLGTSPASNQAQATVTSGSDPDFEQALLLGSVFNDANANGMQDEGERGIPGVRLATVEGLIIETDAYGRFHLEAVEVPNADRGRNFIVKVDAATLPPGSEFTTRNPLVKRVTQGLPARFDFGVKLPSGEIEGGEKQVEMRMGEVFFAPGSAEISAQYLSAIEAMAAQVREHGGAEVVITADGESNVLAMDRAMALRKAMEAVLTPEELRSLTISVRTEVNTADGLIAGIAEWPLLGTVLFDTDRATLKPQYAPLMAKIADIVQQFKGTRVVITGHTDKRASDEYNVELGMRRARTVYDAILQHISPELREQFRVDLSNDPAAPAGNTEK
jgi:uncharacterized repeat protein (TIGR01451 family)